MEWETAMIEENTLLGDIESAEQIIGRAKVDSYLTASKISIGCGTTGPTQSL